METLQWLGAPYAQADYASIGPELEGKTEMDALIAYLQGLGVRAGGAAP